MIDVGEYIKKLRIEKGMTQEELGAALGVQKAAVNKWECGRTQNLKRDTMRNLARLFDVPASSFVDDDTAPQLTSKEQELIDMYRALPEWMRKLAAENLTALYREKQKFDKMNAEKEA